MSPRLAQTRLVKIRGEHRWKAMPAYRERPCTPDEIAGLFHQFEHDTARSKDPATALVARYQALSAASLVLGTVVLRAWEYEAVPKLDPACTFGALPDLFGPEGRTWAKTFLAHDRKSRRRKFWSTRPGTLAEACRELSRDVDLFKNVVLEWLGTTRAHLLKKPSQGSQSEDPSQGMLF
jgi:hypothetical protein